MGHSAFRSFWTYCALFIIIYFIIVPLSFRRHLRNYFFLSQVPIFHMVDGLKAGQSEAALHMHSKSWWIKKSQELIQENAYLKWQLEDQKDRMAMAQNILKLNKINVSDAFKCLPAHVIYRSIESWSQYVIVNRGTKDGVRVGQGVICTSGVVGRISQVQDHLSFVELITAPNFRMLVHLDGDASPHTFMGIPSNDRYLGQAKISDLSSDDQALGPRRIETNDLGQQFPNHIFVGQCIAVYPEGNQWVGQVQLGHYLKWLDEVGILISTMDILQKDE